MGETTDNLTPAMRQYRHFKQQYPQAILFFRMGDFYETFYEDAQTCSKVLGIALTTRNKGENPIPLAGVPYHAVDSYLHKMIKAGYKVAVCEQVEDPAQAKGVVKRDVVRLVTPGTLTEDALLDERSGNYLAAVWQPKAAAKTSSDQSKAGLAWVDLSTGEFFAQRLSARYLLDELVRLRVAECLVSDDADAVPESFIKQLRELTETSVTRRPGWLFDTHQAAETLKKHFRAATLAGFGFEKADESVIAAGVILEYLHETQKTTLDHIHQLRRVQRERYLQLDQNTLRSLEVERTLRDSGRAGTLLACLDETRTAMGARRLRQWVCYPLNDAGDIQLRQDGVAELVQLDAVRQALRDVLGGITDIERITTRISTGRASPRDVLGLGQALRQLPKLRQTLGECSGRLLMSLAQQCETLDDLAQLIEAAVDTHAGLSYRDGGIIRDGYDEEVDRLRSLCRDGQTWLAAYQKRLIDRTGLASLKVGYNRVFGYYIEVSQAYRGEVPGDFVRKQTLKNAERYITDELKQYETEALTAQQRCKEREASLFEQLREKIASQTLHLQQIAEAVATIDVLANLAHLARRRNYCRPLMVETTDLDIRDGRHPVLDVTLGGSFVPNDVQLSSAGSLAIITGPNMSGKSTYIRQTALLVLMAQMGGYIPAASARIGLVDRIFTRVGASDELTRGQSTFMVEMTETANILNNATNRSLVILDEVGRGTSTYDGLALAWAISEHIATAIGCRTLFATHYHEITALGDLLANVINLNVAVREWKDEVVFLHRIEPGRTDKSYGVHVARLAGIPKTVLRRSEEILAELENNFAREAHRPQLGGRLEKAHPAEPTLFDNLCEDPLLQKLRGLDLNSLTPLQAINLLHEIKTELEQR